MIPFGKAKIVKPGTSLTIVTYGALVQKALQAAMQSSGNTPLGASKCSTCAL